MCAINKNSNLSIVRVTKRKVLNTTSNLKNAILTDTAFFRITDRRAREGKVEGGKVYIGDEAVLEVNGVEDQEVYIGIRPEGVEPNPNGVLTCKLNTVEVMGRDASVISTHPASLNPIVRAIINSDIQVDTTADTIKYNIKPHKFFIFNKETEERIYFEVK